MSMITSIFESGVRSRILEALRCDSLRVAREGENGLENTHGLQSGGHVALSASRECRGTTGRLGDRWIPTRRKQPPKQLAQRVGWRVCPGESGSLCSSSHVPILFTLGRLFVQWVIAPHGSPPATRRMHIPTSGIVDTSMPYTPRVRVRKRNKTRTGHWTEAITGRKARFQTGPKGPDGGLHLLYSKATREGVGRIESVPGGTCPVSIGSVKQKERVGMKRSRMPALWGIVLVIVGVLVLLQNFGYLNVLRGLIWAGAFGLGGLVFLSVFVSEAERWWAVIPGLTLLGLALLIGLDELFPGLDGDWGGMLFLGMIALSFWLIYVRVRGAWWAIIPAGVLTTLGRYHRARQFHPGRYHGGRAVLGDGIDLFAGDPGARRRQPALGVYPRCCHAADERCVLGRVDGLAGLPLAGAVDLRRGALCLSQPDGRTAGRLGLDAHRAMHRTLRFPKGSRSVFVCCDLS